MNGIRGNPGGAKIRATLRLPAPSDRAVNVVAWVGLALAMAYFLWRGLWRSLSNSTDLTYGYAAAHAWLAGRNPYDAAVLEEIVVAAGGPVVPIAIGAGVYPPTALPLFIPLGLVSWPEALLVGVGMNVAATLIIAISLVRWLGVAIRSPAGLGLIAFILALAPVHTTVAFAQTALVATAAIVVAMLLERSRRTVLAGFGYGLAAAIKLQIGLPFVAYLVWRRRWAAAASATALLGVLTLVGAMRMHVASVPWVESLAANLAWLSGPDGNAYPGAGNPDRFSLVNLHYLISAFGAERLLADVVTLGFVGGASLWLGYVIRGRCGHELLAISTVAVLTLLVTYHRYYDAVLLALPIAWAISALRTPRRLQAIAVLVLCAVFLVPGQTALNGMLLGGILPAWLDDTVIWSTVLLTQHVWALVLMVPVLLWAATRLRFERGVMNAVAHRC